MGNFWACCRLMICFHLQIPRTELAEKDITSVRRVKVARGRMPRLEVVVRFVDVETRDLAASYARNLGDFIENGKPTATFRHEIPTNLSGVHKSLLQYGYLMAEKHGKGLKRNIRFDDIMYSFCIDIRMPGSTKWTTVNHERAIVVLRDHRPRSKKCRRPCWQQR